MHVYLVRHGQTELNKKHIHQFPSTPLSYKGKEEVQTTAEYLRSMNPDLLLSSEYTRALETARVIGAHVGLIPEKNNLFYEIIRPSSLYGKSHFSIETFKYVILSVLKRKDKDWRYKDAENMHDLIDRTRLAIDYISGLEKKHDSIIIVSHSVFLNFLIAHMCKPGVLSFWELLQAFIKMKFTKNGSVIHFEYMQKKKGSSMCAWQQI